METDELTSNIIDVTIAKYPHFDGFLCAATSVGTIICKQCKQGIGKAQWSNHLKSAHSDLLSVTGKLIGCTELDKTCSKLIGQCPSGAFENIHGKRHAHIAALGEPTVCYHSLECQEQLVPCFYAAATRNAVRFHLLQVHGIRFDSEKVVEVQGQHLYPNSKRTIMLLGNGNLAQLPPEDTVAPIAVGNEDVSFEQLYGLPPNETPVVLVAENFRRHAMVEQILNMREVIPLDCVGVAAWMISHSNPCFSASVNKELHCLTQEFMVVARQRTMQVVPPNFRSVLAEKSEKFKEFNATHTDCPSYQLMYRALIRWFALLFGKVSYTAEQDEGNANSHNQPNHAELFSLIPPKWKTIDANIEATFTVLWDSLVANAALDGGDVNESPPEEVVDAVWNPDKCQHPKYFAKTVDFFAAVLVRQGEMNRQDVQLYDPIAYFVAAVVTKPDGSRQISDVATGRISGLEYAMRASLLWKAFLLLQNRCAENVNSQVAAGEACTYIKNFGMSDAQSNNVAYMLQYWKQRIRDTAAKETQSYLNFTDFNQRLDMKFVNSKICKAVTVGFHALQQGYESVYKHAEVIEKGLLGDFTYGKEGEVKVTSIDLATLHDGWSNTNDGYSFVTDTSNRLSTLWKVYGDQNFGHSTEWEVTFLREARKLRESLAFLLHVFGGGPSRSTSLVVSQIMNTTDMMRSFIVFQGDLFFCNRYQKSQYLRATQAMHSVKCFPQRLARMFVNYLVLFRPMESAIFRRRTANTILGLQSQTYFFIKPSGQPMNEDGEGVSGIVASIYANIVGIPLKFQQHRHMVQALTRQWLTTGNDHRRLDGMALINEQMDHSDATGELYGNTDMDPHNPTYFACAVHASRMWQDFLACQITPQGPHYPAKAQTLTAPTVVGAALLPSALTG